MDEKWGIVQHAAVVQWRVCFMVCPGTQWWPLNVDVDDGFKHVLDDRAPGWLKITKITYWQNITRLIWAQSRIIDPILVSQIARIPLQTWQDIFRWSTRGELIQLFFWSDVIGHVIFLACSTVPWRSPCRKITRKLGPRPRSFDLSVGGSARNRNNG